MRILYGVTGEGMGHATRSKVVCEYLVSQGHDVKIVVSGRAHGFLAKSFPDVVEIKGLSIKYVNNAMDRDGSLARNVLAAPALFKGNIGVYMDKLGDYRPDLVITDFDSFAHLFAKRHGLPLVSIDNQAIIHRCKHDKAIKKGVELDYSLTKAFIKAKIAGCDEYVVTTFFYPPIRKKFADNTVLVPPMLRQAVLDAKAHARLGDHVLVYQTSVSDTKLIGNLNKVTGQKFIVYGLRKSETHGNCVLKEFSEDGFVADLAGARAVVANGGLSLLGEAVFLGKPIYSVPVQHQFEQVMNARYLEELGYGLGADVIEPDVLKLFLGENAKYAARVARHAQDGNSVLYRTLDEVLAKHGGKKAHKPGQGDAKEPKKGKKDEKKKGREGALVE
jgi:uncharacterized protein (TIGR00661 family)